jgi:hypothetical protein
MFRRIAATAGFAASMILLAGVTIPAKAQSGFESRQWKIGVSTNNAKHPFLVEFIK